MRLIDADALINELNNSHYPGAPYIDAGVSIAIGKVCDAPTIEPQRKKGTWIEQDDSWDGVYYECSACGEPWTLIDGTPWDNGMKFCPNCGAEMRDDDGE